MIGQYLFKRSPKQVDYQTWYFQCVDYRGDPRQVGFTPPNAPPNSISLAWVVKTSRCVLYNLNSVAIMSPIVDTS